MAATRDALPSQTFLKLYEELRKKILADHQIEIIKTGEVSPEGKFQQNAGTFGSDWEIGNKQDPNSRGHVAGIIANAPEVRALLEGKSKHDLVGINFGRFLYRKMQDWLAIKPDKVSFQGELYNSAYYRYLGFEDRKAFEAAYGLAGAVAKRDGTLPAFKPDENWTYYIGTYYSFKSYRIKKFLIAINLNLANGSHSFDAVQWGFHVPDAVDAQRNLNVVESIEFQGKAEVSGQHLYINLNSPRAPQFAAMQMHLIGICDPGVQNQKLIPCSLQTVSLLRYSVSVEAILIKTTYEHAQKFRHDPEEYFSHKIAPHLKEEEQQTLHLYLMLERRNFWVRYPAVDALSNLRMKGAPVRNFTNRLKGVWRIWNFGMKRGVVVQSRLEIRDEPEAPFSTYFYPYINPGILKRRPGLAEQVGVLSLSLDPRQDQLCFATFIKNHLSLANYAIFDLEGSGNENFVKGMFVSGGYDTKGIIGGYAVMCKADSREDVPVNAMQPEEAEAYARELGLTKMYNGIRSLWAEKLWKFRKRTYFGVFAVAQDPARGVLLTLKTQGVFAGKLGLPGGVLKYGESPSDALRRIVKEETGLSIDSLELWQEASVMPTVQKTNGEMEEIHSVGFLYKVTLSAEAADPGATGGQFWVRENTMPPTSFSPITQQVLDELFGRK